MPDRITIDSSSETTLKNEYLTNSDGEFEVVKEFDCSVKTPKETVFANAMHPIDDNLKDLLQLKNSELKKRANDVSVNLQEVDKSSNVELRKAIREKVNNLQTIETHIPLSTDNVKKVWEAVQKSLPLFALFQSDRPSKDDDREVSDPMKLAVQAAVREVQDELDCIKKKVQESVLEVAERTLKKLTEMDKNLSESLVPTFKSEPKWDGFKLTLSGEDGIPINKRGSGVRRLILLNFFRAEAEKRRNKVNSQKVIYAIEEPENSQHPNNQKMIIKSLLTLSNDENTQVIMTTHVPSVAAQIPTESVRLVENNDYGKPIVHVGADNIYQKVIDTLGILPDKRAQVAIYVEGPNDVEFLIRASKLYHEHDETFIDLENDYRIAFIVAGGGNLKHWVDKNYLRNALLKEVHIYDMDDKDKPRYKENVKMVNERQNGDIGFLRSKREMENYIHEDAINAYYGINIKTQDWCDVPKLGQKEVSKKKISVNKKLLNTDVMDRLTLKQLEQKDDNKDILTWLNAIKERVQ